MVRVRLVIALFCSSLSAAVLAADPINVPPSATPGAVEPGRVQSPPARDNEYYLFDLLPSNGKPATGDEGERTFVRSIVLDGVIEHPRAGVTLEGVRKLVEKYRGAGQNAGEGTSGKTTQTQAGQSQIGPKDAAITGGKTERELEQDPRAIILDTHLTIGQLQAIAGDITNFYRKNGFILAQAYVPEQKVINGDVVIRVLEGKLGRVLVENNELYGRRMLLKPFAGDLGQPVYKQSIETGLLRLTDYPGLSVFGVFKPGGDVGTTDLVLKVRNEKRVNFNLQADNYGSKFTGDYRLRGDVAVNNLTGSADVLSGSLMQTLDPSNGIYGALSYERPLGDIRDSIGAGYSKNAYDIGGDLAGSGISGTSEISHLFWRRSFQREIRYNSYALLDFARKDAALSSPVGTADRLAVVSAEYDLNDVNPSLSNVDVGLIRISQGFGGVLGAMQSANAPGASRKGGSGKNAGGDFTKLEFRYDRIQRLTINQTWSATLSGQYSNDLLTSIEQMALGGPTSVRAYPISEFLVDSGYFASLEWTMGAPGFASKAAFNHYTWGQVLQFAAFADVGGGTLNDPLPTDRSSINIGGVGVGLRFNTAGFSTRLDVAKPIMGVTGQNVKAIQAYLNIISKF